MITAYPLVFTIGPFHLGSVTIGALHITGFGIMMMLAFLVGGWLIDRECRRLGFAPDYAGDVIIGGVVGGIVGAKLWYVALNGPESLLARGGLVWYGGFIGGTIGVVLNGWRRRVPVRWTAHLVAPALAAAYAVGRVGCFLVGDDYGIPTRLPWAVAFPDGMPPSTVAHLQEFNVAGLPALPSTAVLAVHPTQLYEVAIMLCAFAFLWRWRTLARGTGWLFGAYLMMAGAERFCVEFLRAKDDRRIGGFTLAQGTAVLCVVIGFALFRRWSDAPALPPGKWLEGGHRGSLQGPVSQA